MATNNKGKRIFTGSDEEEWVKVLDNCTLSDLVLEGFGDEPISEYASYRNIPNELRERIVIWLRKHEFYYEELLGVSEDNKEDAGTELPEFDALESRISNLEAIFKHLKERKESKEKKERKERADAESSGCNF